MHRPVQHVYKRLHAQSGMLYAWFPSMHTRVDIALCHHQQKTEEELLCIVGQIYDELQQLEQTGSFYDATSELHNVNQQASHYPVSLSQELYTLIDLCLEYHPKTFGCFDVTIQSDNYSRETHQSLTLSTDSPHLFYRQAGIRIDLSGLLKGYALEKIRSVLQQQGVTDALVNMGNSSVLALGNHPHGEGWKVSFDTSMSSDARNEKSVLLRNQCLTTSGNDTSERKHIVCPRSGKLIEGIRRLAVVTDDAALGEILSTSLFIATQTQRESLLRQFRIKKIYDL